MQSIQLPEGAINWNGGQRITLRAGDTATCTTLNPGQLYGIFIYNSAQNDTNATVNVVWSNSQLPVQIMVPGTTANAGLASLGFVSGTDTQTVSVSLPSNAGIAQVEIWLGSVSMPIDTSGLTNQLLPIDGNEYPFNEYTRYYSVPPTEWLQVTIVSPITQFISVQFSSMKAYVLVVNETLTGLQPGQVVPMGPTATAAGAVTIDAATIGNIQKSFQGGMQWVWMDADNQQDSQTASISLQSLSFE